jgi:RecA/RadA recombinase
MDPYSSSDKPIAKFVFARWGREQAAALLLYQQKHGLSPSSVRDAATRESLRPCVFYTDDDAEKQEALAAWEAGEDHPLVDLADRPIVIGWDSVAGTPTERELEGSARDSHPAAAARVIKANFRRLIQLLADEAVAFVLVNQRYEKIDQGSRSWGQKGRGPSETYGGSGIKYHTTCRIEVEKVGSIHQSAASKEAGDPPMGQIVRIKIAKNKVNNPFHRELFGLVYGRGADNAWAIYEDLKIRAIIRVSGGWSKFSDPTILGSNDRSFRGWMELSNMMAEDSSLWLKLKAIYLEGR